MSYLAQPDSNAMALALAQYLNHGNTGVLAFDRDFRIILWNRNMESLTGKTHDAAKRTTLLTLLRTCETSPEARALAATLRGEQTILPMSNLMFQSSNSLYWEAHYQPLYEDQTIIGGMIIFNDVTARRMAEELARESDVRFQIMADHAPVLLWMAGTDARCYFFNQEWLKFTGRSMEQETGYGWAEGIHAEDFQLCVDTYMEAFNARQSFRMEYRMLRFDGEYRWILDTGISRYLKDGQFAGFIGSCVDITEIKEAEQRQDALFKTEQKARDAAERSFEEAKKVSRIKDEFLATISHELRTPMSAILGWSELLKRGELMQSEINMALETIERNARSQNNLINDLLDVSRIITGKAVLNRETTLLYPIIQQSIEGVSLSAEAKGIEITFLADSNVGPIDSDPMRIQQILWNLLSNAVKFTSRNGKISVELKQHQAEAEITVTDTGEGIDPEFLPYVFDRFRQADSSLSRRQGGLGLGLSIVKHMVELHGGHVHVHSEGKGSGSVFTVTFPLSTAAADGNSAPRSAQDNEEKGEHRLLSNTKILVVDDVPDVLNLVAFVFNKAGAQVVKAGNATTAYDRFVGEKPDFIVCDIEMPGGTGYEFIEKVRALPSTAGGDCPAAALTAHVRSEDRAKALQLGFQAHIAKPVNQELLIATTARLLGKTPLGLHS